MIPLPMLRDWNSTTWLWVSLVSTEASKWERERLLYIYKSGIGKSEQKKYINRNNGLNGLKTILAFSMINFTIALE